ncbi:MAG: pantetheine-phosphate adenylyltransferase [Actinobacteria bacterium]|nr:pantetheine-phosphate adenylyltransferase [Actinomycetota bacterium]
MKIAVCPGSFDPITSGHLDIIERATFLYDKIIVAVAKNTLKKPLFSVEERMKFAEEAVKNFKGVEVKLFDCLLVEFAQKNQAQVIVRGLRAITDFEHEFQMAQLNRKLDRNIETIFMMASPEYGYLSSSAVKEIAKFNGQIEGLVPKEVEISLRRLFGK